MEKFFKLKINPKMFQKNHHKILWIINNSKIFLNNNLKITVIIIYKNLCKKHNNCKQ